MNTKSYFSQYESPNIVIIPNMSLSNPPSPKRRRIGNNILVPIVDNETCENMKFLQEQGKLQVPNTCADKKVGKNINSPNNPMKKGSWASKYLQSIGLDSQSSIWQHKIPRKNASQSCVSKNSLGTMTSNVTPNSTCSTNAEKCDQSKKINTIKTNTLEEKSNQDFKNNTETQKTKKHNKKEKYLPKENIPSQNEDVNNVSQKYINDFKNNAIPTTFLSTNKNKNSITLTKKLTNDSIIKCNLIKRPLDDGAGRTSRVDKHSLPKKSENAVKAQKQPNSKMSTDHPNLMHNKTNLNNDKKSKCSLKAKSNCREGEMKDSVKNTKQNAKCMKRLKTPTSYSSDKLKTKHKTQPCSIGHVTSLKSVVKVTKKYDIDDLKKLTASKKKFNTNEPTNSAVCDQKNLHKNTKEISSKKKLDTKPRNIKHKKIIKSPIKKQSHKAKKYRKIKLVINVVCNNKPISAPCNSNDINKGNTACATQNVDLDFLNDFDVDEIVQSLDLCDREGRNLESAVNKEICNVNSNIFPGAYDNDALDLIKILKGEEDDDLIKQSIEGTSELFSSSNIRTGNSSIDNYIMLDRTQSSDKIGVISNYELDMPIKIKEEKQDIIATATDLHVATDYTYDTQSYCENKEIYEKGTPTFNLGSDTITKNNEEAIKANTNKQVINNEALDADTKTVKCSKIIEEENKIEISANPDDNIAIYKKERVKNAVNGASDAIENSDNHNQYFDQGEITSIEKCDIQKEEAKLCNNEVETTDTVVQQPDITDNESQTETYISNRKIEQKDVGSGNVFKGNEDETTVISDKLKSDANAKSVNKCIEVKHQKNNDIPERIENEQKDNSEVHKSPTSLEKQGQDIYKDPKNLNDEGQNTEKQVIKDFNTCKSKATNDSLTETATSLDGEKINNKALLTTNSNKKPNMFIDLATKLEQSLFAYLGTKYSLLTTIHQGKFSTIFKCKHPSGKFYALKSLHKNNSMNMHKKHMLYSLQNGRPKNDLFTIYLVSAFNFGNKWYILMDYYAKNLDQVLSEVDKPFCIESVQEYARQLVTAVMVLKSNKMVHTDIKPQHILINSLNTTLKLCGFDELRYVNQITPLPCVGTASYRAPELILGYSAGYEIDVWSTATVLYEMAVNQKLLPGVFNNDILYKQICTLGTVPTEMIKKSRFAHKHFSGTIFMRRTGILVQKISILKNIMKNNKLRKSIYDTYRHYWGAQRNMAEKNYDMEKLARFITMLEKMLVMHPRYRISIEYVFKNTFIYDAYKYEEW